MSVTRQSPCKVNLLLNILGRRPDGFHQLETVFQPLPLQDELNFERQGQGLLLTCSDPRLPTDARNLVHRAASLFLERAGIRDGLRIHLEKRIPIEAGLGGGSGNAAGTLLGLNELFGFPLAAPALGDLAATLGSDVVFFLHVKPALATGRGEEVVWLDPFIALRGASLLLIHPGFGVSTAWAYRQLAQFPSALAGRPGRARALVTLLQGDDLPAAAAQFYNALEAPVLRKYPLLALFQDYLREQGAVAALMSGSGSTTFALARCRPEAERLRERFLIKFGDTPWTALVEL